MDNPAAIPPGRIRLIPYFRIIWGGKEVIRGNWYLGLIGLHTKGYPRELWIYLSMRGFLRWSAGTLVVMYFVGAAALTWFYSRNPYNKITYADLILPTRWSELRTLRGEANIEEGLAKLKAKQYGAAFMLLNQGLARKPDNIPARLVVAQMYTSMGYFNRAMRVYRDGIPYAAEQRRFMEATFKLAEYMEDYPCVLELIDAAEKVIPAHDLANHRFFLGKRILANEKLGRHADNLNLWQAAQPNSSMRLNVAWARALSATGQADEAIITIQQNPTKFGLLREPWDLLLELARTNDRTDAGRHAVDALVALEPARYRFLAIRIAYLAEIGATDEALAAVGDYFFRFGYDEAAAVALLKATEGKPNSILLERIWAETHAAGKITPAAYVSHIRSLMQLGKIDDARRQLTAARELIARTHYPDVDWIEGTTLLLNAMESDTPSSRSLLESFIAQRALDPEAYRKMTQDLLNAGQPEIAHKIATLGRTRFPSIRGLPATTSREQNRKLDAPMVQSPAAIISNSNAQHDLDALEIAFQAKEWAEALGHINAVEKSPLARTRAETLLYQRLVIHSYLSMQTELSWSVRQFLSGRPDLAKLRKLADQLAADDRKDSAITILREVLRKHPDARWATDQLRSWEPAQ